MRRTTPLLSSLLFLSACLAAPTQRPTSSQRPGQATPNAATKTRPQQKQPATAAPASNDEISRIKRHAARDPQNAQLNYILAVRYAQAGDANAATAQLERLIRKNWTLGVDLEDFRKIQANPQYRALASKLRSAQAKARSGTVAATLDQKDLSSQGITWDQGRNRFYVGSSKNREVLAVTPEGKTQRVPVSNQQASMAPRGMRVEPDGKILWVATAGSKGAQKNRSVLLAIDLQSAKVLGRFESGDAQNPSQFEDVQPLGDGRRAIVSDSARGTLMIASLGKNAIAPMLQNNSFESPKALTYDPVGERLFVGDALGISVMGIESSRHKRVRVPAGAYVGGADSLSWWKGTLIGVQSDTGDQRIWAANVSEDSLDKPRVLSAGDTRLGTVSGATTNSKGLWLIANPKAAPARLFHIPL